MFSFECIMSLFLNAHVMPAIDVSTMADERASDEGGPLQQCDMLIPPPPPSRR